MIDAYSVEFMNRQSPQWWYNKASQLHASAGVVWQFGVANKIPDSIKKELGFPSGFSFDAGCLPVFPLLCGLAIESLLKGIIARSGSKAVFSHKLVELAETTTLELDEALKKNLRFLSECVIWAGKYPVPKQENHLRTHRQEHSDISWSWDEHRKIWDRFASEFFAGEKNA
jgi:hypothetical protein